MAIRPTPAMASRALTHRFARIWSIWEGSITTGHTFASGCQVIVMSSPIMRCSILTVPPTARLMSSTRGKIACFRAKERSWRVRSAECSAAVRISFRESYSRCAGSTCSRAISACPRMTPSMLLKSWATPPEGAPRIPFSAPGEVIFELDLFRLSGFPRRDILHPADGVGQTAIIVVESSDVRVSPHHRAVTYGCTSSPCGRAVFHPRAACHSARGPGPSLRDARSPRGRVRRSRPR